MTQNPLLALVGCGAISEEFYIPALRKLPDYESRVWLVDPSERRLADLVSRFGFRKENAVTTIERLPDGVVGAFNATPSHLHLETALALISRGVSVFLEKPLAERRADAKEIMDAAAGKVTLSSNQFRRRYPAYRTVGEYIRAGKLGRIHRASWSEGGKFEWPTQSGFYFRRPWPDNRPRGALLDTGSHVVDVLCWWLGAEPKVLSARTDGYNGPEAFAEAKLEAADAVIDLQISFLAKLPNQYVIVGDAGAIRGASHDTRRFFFTPKGGSERAVVCSGPSVKAEIGDELVNNFDRAAQGLDKVLIDAATVLPSLGVIDAIYAAAERPLPTYYRTWQQ